jgi:hypothetical protein
MYNPGLPIAVSEYNWGYETIREKCEGGGRARE